MNDTLSRRIEESCRTFSERTAAYDGSGAPIMFENLFLTLLAFAERLEEEGVRSGALVAIEVADGIISSLLRLALMRIGAVALPGLQRDMEQIHGLPVTFRVHTSPLSGTTGTDIAFDASWIASPRRIVPISGQGRIVRSTSGTTGTPKLRVMDEASMLARVDHGLNVRGAPMGPVIVGYHPSSSPGFNMFLRVLVSGETQVFQQATPEATLDEMDRRKVVTAYLSPFNFNRLLETAKVTGKRPRSLERLVVGGGTVSMETASDAERHFDAILMNSYGSNETGSIAWCRVARTVTTPGVVGKLYDGFDIRFAGSDGNQCEPGQGGEISIWVPPALRVVNYPEMTPVCDPDGWVKTGDVGRLLPDGQICLTGRKAEFLNVGGTKRAPVFFEEIANAHPLVKNATAFRAPLDNGMDHVGLAIQPKDGFQLDEFGRYMVARLGPTFPLHVAIVDSTPVNVAGKIDRTHLTNLFIAAHKHALQSSQ